MSTSELIHVTHTLVCDDVRQEINGKQILIGVYGSRIVAQQFPANLGLCFWIEAFANSLGSGMIEFKLTGNKDIELIQGGLQVDIMAKDDLFLPIKLPPMIFQVPMELEFSIKQPGSKWELVKEVSLVKGALPSVAAPPTAPS